MWHSAKLCVAQTSCVLLIVLCATTALLCDLNTYSELESLIGRGTRLPDGWILTTRHAGYNPGRIKRTVP
ncbi:hypothetical protein PF010_g32429 [Phytophthora fragariae]|uniref:Uncharacterized protein n=1 Tax=Phytophthora fragariae TaxID=53985 RepID=A0A6A3DWV2_9STRA|nr:hypothetical protein PF003_g2961 [Phytophthora fragariae]KAE8924407.1 hypothetical protein PF009_g25364 [Phytophthora fragariae]KAE8977442.1 hypothetical protein PF011_g23648 [Phytophthora fragariae]KAE9054682.1 hypothetical protein PF010_g32429 [Phytophthora fragariae]KAE9055554.1 hypothetical protein PF007_g32280 [Phytophthora fragariae]